MKFNTLNILLCLLIISCSKKSDLASDSTSSGHLINPEIQNGNVVYNENSQRNILKSYTSFEVEVPAQPVSIAQYSSVYNSSAMGNFSGPVYLDFALNNDNTVDVFYISSSEKYDGMYRQENQFLSRISIDSKNLLRQLNIPAIVRRRDSRFLGFESLGNNQYIIGHSSVAELTSIRAVSIDGNKTISEAYYTSFNGDNGSVKYTTRMWKDPDIMYENFGGPKYLPAQASTPAVAFNKEKDLIAVYMGHRTETGHQGGFFAMMRASTGELITKISNGKKSLVGREWNYSHVFDMRLIPTNTGNANFYTLSHLDALPKRALMFTEWNASLGRLEGQFPYLDAIPGEGNQTYSKTGDFLELPNGDVAVIYATAVVSQTNYQGAKNAKLAIITGLNTNNPRLKKEVWLSSYPVTSNTEAGPGMQLGVSANGKELLVGWNIFNGNMPLRTAFRLVDFDGNLTSTIEESQIPLLYHGQSMRRTSQGKLIFVSSGIGRKIMINLIE